jgi:hypothetical protein
VDRLRASEREDTTKAGDAESGLVGQSATTLPEIAAPVAPALSPFEILRTSRSGDNNSRSARYPNTGAAALPPFGQYPKTACDAFTLIRQIFAWVAQPVIRGFPSLGALRRSTMRADENIGRDPKLVAQLRNHGDGEWPTSMGSGRSMGWRLAS